MTMYDIFPIAEDMHFLRYSGKNWPTSSNIFLIKDAHGLAMVDTGLNRPEVFQGLESALDRLGYGLRHIHTILLTHGHTDHIAGANHIRDFCNPRILLPKKCLAEALDPKKQEAAVLPRSVRELVPTLREYDILTEFKDSCGEWVLSENTVSGFDGDEDIELGKYRFRPIPTPGHDIGLMVYYESGIKLLLSTDLLRSSVPGNALPWYASTAGGVSAYLDSLDRVEDLDVASVYPSHGTFERPFEQNVQRTRDIILKREHKIVVALREAARTCSDLDAMLYSPQVLTYCPWFSSCTEAHLVKLEAEGKVMRDGLLFAWNGR
jgi:glyoxylase-like metal-dependent hydrolase (beta-lactamase superfamily II)